MRRFLLLLICTSLCYGQWLYFVLEKPAANSYGELFRYSPYVGELQKIPLPQGLQCLSLFKMAKFNNQIYLVLGPTGRFNPPGQLYRLDENSIFNSVALPSGEHFSRSYGSEMLAYKDKLYLTFEESTLATSVLWSYNGTGFSRVPLPGDLLVTPASRFQIFQNRLFMSLHEPNSTFQEAKLYAFDGTSLEKIATPANLDVSIVEMEVYENKLYFVLSDHNLYSYDGLNVTQVEAPTAVTSYYDMEAWNGDLFYPGQQENLLSYHISGYVENIDLPYESFIPSGFSMRAFNEYLYVFLEDRNRGPVRFLYEYDGELMTQVYLGDGYRCAQYTDTIVYGVSGTPTSAPATTRLETNVPTSDTQTPSSSRVSQSSRFSSSPSQSSWASSASSDSFSSDAGSSSEGKSKRISSGLAVFLAILGLVFTGGIVAGVFFAIRRQRTIRAQNEVESSNGKRGSFVELELS